MRADSSIHWSAYPALFLAGLFAIGIVLERSIPLGVLVWGAGVVSGAVAFAITQWLPRRQLVTLRPLAQTVIIVLVVVCVGGARQAVYQTPSPRALKFVADAGTDRPVTLSGVVRGAPERSDSTTRATVTVDSLRTSSTTHAVTGRVRVTLQPPLWENISDPFPRLYEGDYVHLRGTLRTPSEQRNPGGFDYAAYLSRRGVCCLLHVDDPGAVRVRRRASSLGTAFVVDVRQHIREQIARYVPSEGGRAVLRALLLADRSGISDAQQERFARTGLMHLLAVSGLHVFLVGMVLYTLLQPVLMRLRLRWMVVEAGRALLTIGVLGGYLLITGARPSVVRAVVMSTLLIGGILFQRSAHPLNTLGVAVLLLLGMRPPALFDAGFQLSVTAVTGIIVLHPRFREWCPPSWTSSTPGDWLTSTVTTSAAATIGTAPVLFFHFGWVSFAGLVLNVFAIPCTGLALSASIVMTLLGGLWPLAGAAFGSGADLFVQGLLFSAQEGMSWLGWAGVRMSGPSGWTLGAMGAGIFALAQWPRPRHRWRGILCALVLATGGVWSESVVRTADPTLDVLFFDVGQGDAVLVTTPTGRRMLVDTGAFSLSGVAASFSVLPYLQQKGIDSLDVVVITHPDADHLGGLPSILKEVAVDRVVHSGQVVDTDLFHRTRRRLQKNEVTMRKAVRGDSVSLGTCAHVQILGPPSHPRRQGIESENGQSVVLRLVYGDTAVLLPGDIEAPAEKNLVNVYGSQLKSDVIKVPHHGSSTSSTEEFVEATVEKDDTDVVVSVGRSNRFGMPDTTVMSRWRSTGARVHSTARDGAHWFRTNGEDVWQVQWQQ